MKKRGSSLPISEGTEYKRLKCDCHRFDERHHRRKMKSKKHSRTEDSNIQKKSITKEKRSQITRNFTEEKLKMKCYKIVDKSSDEYQRVAWEALEKSIHSLINKVNKSNIEIIVNNLLKKNIERGKGLLCRFLLQAQTASPIFTNIYAAVIAVVNSRFPKIGELLITRCVILFRKSLLRNDKYTCMTAGTFIAHLVNQRMVFETLILEIILQLVRTPTNCSVEIVTTLLKECGERLTEIASASVDSIFQSLKNVLQENKLDKRVQYMIEVIFQIRKNKFRDHPALNRNLDLTKEDEQFIHHIRLYDENLNVRNMLNVYEYDENYLENETKYKDLIQDILGSDTEHGSDADAEDDSEEEEEEKENNLLIKDEAENNRIRFRRTVYLTIQSTFDYQECARKILKNDIKPGQQIELCHIILDCCTQLRTYRKFFGFLAERFCRLQPDYVLRYCEIFRDSYLTIHRLETKQLRNVAKFYAHLLYLDAIPWTILSVIRLNQEDTTSSNKIFIKILFQDLSDFLSLATLKQRLTDPSLVKTCRGIFPKDNAKNTRFAINFFTSIGLRGLTNELRLFLKTALSAHKKMKREMSLSSSVSSSSS